MVVVVFHFILKLIVNSLVKVIMFLSDEVVGRNEPEGFVMITFIAHSQVCPSIVEINAFAV